MQPVRAMGRTVRIGRALGVAVTVDWSWVFTFVLAAWTLVTAGERLLPSVGPGTLTLLSVVAATGLFASLVLHEIAHALASRACGVPVKRLTLFLFGGITDVERAPASPRSEAFAAVAAPLANAALGGALLATASAVGAGPALDAAAAPGAPATLALLLSWFGFANLAIAGLNLLPAFPLDGGRLVRAALWHATGNVERATRWAAWTGQAIGWASIAAGIALAFASHGVRVAAGMWVAFVGWFLASAAAQAYQGVRAQDALAGVTVARVMRRRFRAVPAHVTLATAVRAWRPSNGHAEDVLAVVEGERFVGVLSMDALRSVSPDAWRSTFVSEVVVAARDDVAAPTEEVATTLRTLVDRDVERLPVVDGGRLIGVIERADIERWIEVCAADVSAEAA